MANSSTFSVYQQLQAHIRLVKELLNEIDPSQRAIFINELYAGFLDKSAPVKSHQEYNALRSNILSREKSSLSPEQQNLISKLSEATSKVYDLMRSESK
ncbi:MAG: hypothetical protein ACKOX3_04850 [Bacteroidota bacterium]